MISIRAVRPGDAAVICSHRYRMFAENNIDRTALDAMREPFAAWLEPRLADGRYFGFVAEDAGAVVAGIGLILLDWPPHFLHPESGVRGYILNVYVEPAYLTGVGWRRSWCCAAKMPFASGAWCLRCCMLRRWDGRCTRSWDGWACRRWGRRCDDCDSGCAGSG